MEGENKTSVATVLAFATVLSNGCNIGSENEAERSVWRDEYVTVRNPRIFNSNVEYGDSCLVKKGGYVKGGGEILDIKAGVYHTPDLAARYGTECPDGTVFNAHDINQK